MYFLWLEGSNLIPTFTLDVSKLDEILAQANKILISPKTNTFPFDKSLFIEPREKPASRHAFQTLKFTAFVMLYCAS